MSDTFTVSVSGNEHRALLTVLGYLDIATAEELRVAVGAQSAGEIALDLTGVDFVDSSGLRALIETRDSVVAAGHTFTLCALSASTRRLIEMTGLLETFGITDDDGSGNGSNV